MRRALKLAASILVTVAFTWWAFRDTDWDAQLASLRAANYLWVLPYVGFLLVVHLCRTLRWGFLLAPMERVRFRALNEASGIGFMMLLVLPFRLGEFARPFLIAQRSGVRRSAAMTTVVLERITDGILVAALLQGLILFLPDSTPHLGYVRVAGTAMFAIFAGGLAFLLFAAWHQARAVHLVRASVGRVAPALGEKVAHVVDTFVGALRHFPRGGDAAGFFGLTLLYWAVTGVGMWVLSRAFQCGPGAAPSCQPLTVSLFETYVVLCVLVVGLMIPAAPGMMGTFQAATKVGLSLFLPAAVVNGTGLAYANVMWLCQMAQQVVLGLVLLSSSHQSFRDVAGRLDGGPDAAAG